MGIDFIGLAEDDVHASAIGFPPRDACREVLVGVGDSLVVLFLIFVLFGVGRGIAALPEGLDKVVAFLVVRELPESCAFLVGDDPDYVLVQPFLVGLAQFLFEGTLVLLLLLLGVRTRERIYGIGRGLRLRGFSLRGGSGVGLLISRLVWLVLGNSANDHQTRT